MSKSSRIPIGFVIESVYESDYDLLFFQFKFPEISNSEVTYEREICIILHDRKVAAMNSDFGVSGGLGKLS